MTIDRKPTTRTSSRRVLLFLVALVFTLAQGIRERCFAQDLDAEQQFMRGDSNADGAVDLSDPVHALAFLFLGGSPPPCLAAADANDDEMVDISDAASILSFFFLGGSFLPPPGEQPGLDPTPGIVCAIGLEENLDPDENYLEDFEVEGVPDTVAAQALDLSAATPLLVICWDPHRPYHAAPDIADVEELIFGVNPSVRDYFLSNSHGRFSIAKADFLGWYAAEKSWEHYWEHPDDGGDEWERGHWEEWTEAIRKADATFDYAAYDADGNARLDPAELGILIVIPQNRPFGTNRAPLARELPDTAPLVVDGVRIPVIAEAYIGSPMNLPVVAHELSHLFLNLPDMYSGAGFLPYRAHDFSLMDISYSDSHLDPFHKIKLGWLEPTVVASSGDYMFRAVETSNEAYILRDDSRSTTEYFIIENRQRDLAYDSALPDTGLAVWHVIEDKNVYDNLPAPSGVDPEVWARVSGLGGRGIRLIRPVYGPPVSRSRSLWDGSDRETG